jgi:pimeloyl-ACP methyl ester carboxylesterase
VSAAQRLPVLLVRGAGLDVVSEPGMDEMLKAIPCAETVVVGTAGHMVAGDDNDVFAIRLLSFAAAREADLAAIDPRS